MSIDLEALYIDLHRHPELSFQETRTAGVITRELTALGLEYVEGLGTTGVATSITGTATDDGPVVWLRADMDGLPVAEQTGLAYASTARGIDPAGTDVPVMHACGHDMHVTALLGARAARGDPRRVVGNRRRRLPARRGVRCGRPGDDRRRRARPFPEARHRARPAPDAAPGGHDRRAPGTQMAASDGLTVRLLGRGGHGSRPHATIDPVVMAAATVMRLQTIVSREIDPREMAVVTVGSIHAGLKNNIIPAEAKLELSLRYPDDDARADVLARVERIVRAEAAASGAEEEPVITTDHSLPPTINDADATARLSAAWERAFGEGRSSTRACSPEARTSRGSPARRACRSSTGSGAGSTRSSSRMPSRAAPSTRTSPPTTRRSSPRSAPTSARWTRSSSPHGSSSDEPRGSVRPPARRAGAPGSRAERAAPAASAPRPAREPRPRANARSKPPREPATRTGGGGGSRDALILGIVAGVLAVSSSPWSASR
jgi:hippurate hydrolase